MRAVDQHPVDEWYQVTPEAENLVLDLRLATPATRRRRGRRTVYNLAADMGGMGFIENNKARCMLSVLINTHMLEAARQARRRAVLLLVLGLRLRRRQAADARHRSRSRRPTPTRPMPEDGYGWEKLFSERMCRHFREDFGLTTRVARYHNVYGPHGTWDGRPREGAGGDLPQGRRGQAVAASTRSRSGATASRPAASCTSTTAWTARA